MQLVIYNELLFFMNVDEDNLIENTEKIGSHLFLS
jgi:hypothetical protein